MKKLSSDKRNKLIMVIAGTLVVIGLVYFFLIAPQNEKNRKLAAETKDQVAKLKKMKEAFLQAGATTNSVAQISALTKIAEEDMATGDLFAWTYDTMRQFKVGRHVDITSIGQPVEGPVDLLPNFPYRQIKFQIIGNGFYHDIGRFTADLENKFPHARIINLSVDTTGGPEVVGEKLAFRMEIAALVKPNH